MTATHPGSLYLSGRASLEQPCHIDDDPSHINVNVLFFCAMPHNDTRLVTCTLHYHQEENTDEISEGIYNIYTDVEFSPLLPFFPASSEPHLSFGKKKVVAYQEGVNHANRHNDNNFTLIGDLLKLNSVPVDSTHALSACKITARMIAAGRVASVEKQQHYFITNLSQYVAYTNKEETISIWIITGWQNPYGSRVQVTWVRVRVAIIPTRANPYPWRSRILGRIIPMTFTINFQRAFPAPPIFPILLDLAKRFTSDKATTSPRQPRRLQRGNHDELNLDGHETHLLHGVRSFRVAVLPRSRSSSQEIMIILDRVNAKASPYVRYYIAVSTPVTPPAGRRPWFIGPTAGFTEDDGLDIVNDDDKGD
ncbi:hypothetical protein EDB85DRAFT_1896543 [Lactarius pseudohatsudake]|nr:hypothetical protein EDB85DRAFT_1896543 [Lactarius pseudohatsudake]